MAETNDSGSNLKREFVLASSIFVLLAIIGTVFGLWMVFSFTSSLDEQHRQQQPPVVEPAR